MIITYIEGAKELFEKLDKTVEIISGEPLTQSVGAVTKIIQAEAKNLCSVNHGELRQSIRTLVKRRSASSVEGVVYTNKSYAIYVEFGTGPNGQASHSGISPAVTPTYVQHGWLIPADKIGVQDAERYKLPAAKKDDLVIGYYTKGQAAQPFMYPALKNNEAKAVKYFKVEVIKKLREALRG